MKSKRVWIFILFHFPNMNDYRSIKPGSVTQACIVSLLKCLFRATGLSDVAVNHAASQPFSTTETRFKLGWNHQAVDYGAIKSSVYRHSKTVFSPQAKLFYCSPCQSTPLDWTGLCLILFCFIWFDLILIEWARRQMKRTRDDVDVSVCGVMPACSWLNS